jgi:formylglycine-generating enzyme required for sulfatase activity
MKRISIVLALFVLAAGADPVTTRITSGAVPEITWAARPTGVYALYSAENPDGPFDTQVGTNVTALGYSVSVTDTAGTPAGGKRYYRVQTVAPGIDNYLVLDVSGGPAAASWPVAYTNAVPDLLTDPAYRTTKMVLRAVPAGVFKMVGQYDVTLTRPFYIGVFEVTQAQYTNMVGGANPAVNKGALRPVENVTYNLLRGSAEQGGGGWPTNSGVYAQSFFGRLRAKTGNDHFDLPTDAQWEYAGRAGTTSAFHNGKNPASDTDWAAVTDVARCNFNQGDGLGGYTTRHTAAGSYLPNAWGIYDMHGNIAEWVLDWVWNGAPERASDPVGPNSGTVRRVRGGAWTSPNTTYLNNHLRPSTSAPGSVLADTGVLGFRVVLRLPAE